MNYLSSFRQMLTWWWWLVKGRNVLSLCAVLKRNGVKQSWNVTKPWTDLILEISIKRWLCILHLAMKAGNLYLAQMHLQKGTDIFIKDSQGLLEGSSDLQKGIGWKLWAKSYFLYFLNFLKDSPFSDLASIFSTTLKISELRIWNLQSILSWLNNCSCLPDSTNCGLTNLTQSTVDSPLPVA